MFPNIALLLMTIVFSIIYFEQYIGDIELKGGNLVLMGLYMLITLGVGIWSLIVGLTSYAKVLEISKVRTFITMILAAICSIFIMLVVTVVLSVILTLIKIYG